MTHLLLQETGPGLFYVLSRPKQGLEAEYHDWYNNEHGPRRLSLNFVVEAYRYRSIDINPPIFLATYDVSRLNGFTEQPYIELRKHRSPREKDMLEHKLDLLDRRFLRKVSSRGDSASPAPVLMSVAFVVKNEFVDEMHRWYEEEHTQDIAQIPGWRRSRRFATVSASDMRDGFTELIAIHDFDRNNGLGGPEHETAKNRPWRMRILDLVDSRDNKLFELIHSINASDYQGSRAGNSY